MSGPFLAVSTCVPAPLRASVWLSCPIDAQAHFGCKDDRNCLLRGVLAPLILVSAEPGIYARAITVHQRQAGFLGGSEGGENARGSTVRTRVCFLSARHPHCSPKRQTVSVGKERPPNAAAISSQGDFAQSARP